MNVLVTCAACDRDAGKVAMSASARRVTSLEEVFAITGGRRKTDDTHRVTELVARYSLRSNLVCSLPDRTNHYRGFVVRTVCGMLLHIGHVCGRKQLSGLDDVLLVDAELVKQERDAERLGRHETIIAAARNAARQAERMQVFAGNAMTWIPELSEVKEFPLKGWARAAMQGRSIFDQSKSPDARALRTEASDVERMCRLIGTEGALSDIEEASKRLDRLEARTKSVNVWVDERSRFFVATNMAGAVATVAMMHGVRAEVDGLTIVVFKAGVRARIGLGLYETSPE